MKKLDVPAPRKYDFDKAKNRTLKNNPSACLGFGNRTDITAKEKKKMFEDLNINMVLIMMFQIKVKLKLKLLKKWKNA